MNGMFLWTRDQAAAAAPASGQTPGFDTSRCKFAALDVTVAAFTGGTAPSIQFFVDRLSGDGAWYPVANTAALTAAGPVSVDISPDVPDAADLQHMVFTNQARVRWTFAGTVVATSIKFSGSLYGRS